MASKELTAELGEMLFEADQGGFAKQLYYPREHYENMARIAISTILAALQEPTEVMYQAAIKYHDIEKTPSVYHGIFRAMLNASPLGEQSE